jgi:SNF2 family DNA or RNA helicase
MAHLMASGASETYSMVQRKTISWPNLNQLEMLIKWSSGYHHLITGATSPTPEDAPGGILADDMGLGKTLTMIATVVSGKASGLRFEASEPEEIFHLSMPRIPTRATLVIVPSSCKNIGINL